MPTINKPKKKKINSNNKNISQLYVYNTTRWTRLRNAKLREQPLCEECYKEGRITPAVEVHHIQPFMTGANIEQIKWLGFDYNNLQSLCSDCHKNKHQKNANT